MEHAICTCWMNSHLPAVAFSEMKWPKIKLRKELSRQTHSNAAFFGSLSQYHGVHGHPGRSSATSPILLTGQGGALYAKLVHIWDLWYPLSKVSYSQHQFPGFIKQLEEAPPSKNYVSAMAWMSGRTTETTPGYQKHTPAASTPRHSRWTCEPNCENSWVQIWIWQICGWDKGSWWKVGGLTTRF